MWVSVLSCCKKLFVLHFLFQSFIARQPKFGRAWSHLYLLSCFDYGSDNVFAAVEPDGGSFTATHLPCRRFECSDVTNRRQKKSRWRCKCFSMEASLGFCAHWCERGVFLVVSVCYSSTDMHDWLQLQYYSCLMSPGTVTTSAWKKILLGFQGISVVTGKQPPPPPPPPAPAPVGMVGLWLLTQITMKIMLDAQSSI